MVAALLLALGAMFTAAGVASLTSSASDSSAVASTRTHEGAEARPEAFAARTTAVASSKSGAHGSVLHLDVVAAIGALAAVLLVLGWLVAGRARRLLPRLVIATLGARAPPALV